MPVPVVVMFDLGRLECMVRMAGLMHIEVVANVWGTILNNVADIYNGHSDV